MGQEVICALKCPLHEHPASGGLGCWGPMRKLDLLVPAPAACVPQAGAQTRCSMGTIGSLPIVLASPKLFIKRSH